MVIGVNGEVGPLVHIPVRTMKLKEVFEPGNEYATIHLQQMGGSIVLKSTLVSFYI